MEPVTVRQCAADEIIGAPNLDELLAEYAGESSIVGLPDHNAQFASYKALEQAGVLAVYGAFVDEKLVGFVTILTSILPHYGRAVSITESFFVAKAYRGTGAGLKLLRAAEDHAVRVQSPGLLISTPAGGTLERVLGASSEYRHSNTVFFRELP